MKRRYFFLLSGFLLFASNLYAQPAEFFIGGNFFVNGQSRNDDQEFMGAAGESKIRSIHYHLMPQAGFKFGNSFVALAVGYQRERMKTDQEIYSPFILTRKLVLRDRSFYVRLMYNHQVKIASNVWLFSQLNLDYLMTRQVGTEQRYSMIFTGQGLVETREEERIDSEIDYFNPSLSIGARVAAGKSIYLEILYGKLGYRWDMEKEITSKGEDIDFTINTLTLGIKYVFRKDEQTIIK